MYFNRNIQAEVLQSITNFPITAIIGPRQCGKSTLAKHILKQFKQSIYLDLERPSDIQKLEDAEWFLQSHRGKLICIDEIQRRPDLFPLLRSIVDEWNIPSCFIILGSASRDLLRQSSESLAGRITYKKLTPFLWCEIQENFSIETYFSAGAFPRSLIANSTNISFEWRENFISTFLERDLLQWKGFTPTTMRRLWTMLAHINGQTVNYSTLSNSLGVSATTIKNYIDLLEATFMVEIVPPYISNLGKRLVKAPKVYIADSGITATLLGLRSFDEIMAHPAFGAIWEQIVLLNLKGQYPNAEFYHYRTNHGAEIDIVMRLQNTVVAIECKATVSPKLSKGNHNAIADIQAKHSYIVCPIKEGWAMQQSIDVIGLGDINKISSIGIK